MTEQAQAAQQQQQEPVQLSLQDIATMVQFVDVASRRGAVAGNEMAVIGMLRNKMEVFLQQNMPQDGAPNGQMPAPDVPADAPLADKVEA